MEHSLDSNAVLTHLNRMLTMCAKRTGLEPASVRPCVLCNIDAAVNFHTFELVFMFVMVGRLQFLSEASLGWGKAALGFRPDRTRTLVTMATDSSHRVIMGKSC